MGRLLKRVLIAFSLVTAAFVVLFTCHYFLLWKPSLEGKCASGARALGSPEPPLPRFARFKGEVVGMSFWLLQYRWLRRRFEAVGTKLSLVRELPSTEYQGNVVRQGERAGELIIDRTGRFDFGDLKPGVYDLTVTYPGEDAEGYGFVIDPSARATEILIDASPAYYCHCCGWDFEPR